MSSHSVHHSRLCEGCLELECVCGEEHVIVQDELDTVALNLVRNLQIQMQEQQLEHRVSLKQLKGLEILAEEHYNRTLSLERDVRRLEAFMTVTWIAVFVVFAIVLAVNLVGGI